MNNSSAPIRMGLAGLGGYAGAVCDTLLQSTDASLVAVYEPNYAPHAERVQRLKSAGVALCDSYESLLSQSIEAVWLPLPIHLHRPYTEQAVARKIAVLCEKPAAGTVQDLDAMIAARDRAGAAVAIGFQHLCDPAILTLKRRLVAGEFGAIRTISVIGGWPRSSGYYGRNNWAGRLRVGNTWILDSPLANAMNHYLQLAMYLGGSSVADSAMPGQIEAELYRVNPIENFDTCSIRVTLDREVPLLVLMTHACEQNLIPHIRLRCENGDITVTPEESIVWTKKGERGETPLRRDVRETLARSFRDFVRRTPDAPAAIATLEIARAPLAVVNAVATAAPIHTVDERHIRAIKVDDGILQTIPNIERDFETCESANRTLHEQGIAWSAPPKSLVIQPPYRFTEPYSAG